MFTYTNRKRTLTYGAIQERIELASIFISPFCLSWPSTLACYYRDLFLHHGLDLCVTMPFLEVWALSQKSPIARHLEGQAVAFCLFSELRRLRSRGWMCPELPIALPSTCDSTALTGEIKEPNVLMARLPGERLANIPGPRKTSSSLPSSPFAAPSLEDCNSSSMITGPWSILWELCALFDDPSRDWLL